MSAFRTSVFRFIAFNCLYVGSCGYALVRGGSPERIAAALLVANFEASWFLISARAVRFEHLEVAVMVADALLWVALYALSLPSRRYWIMWMSALQGMVVLAHLTILVPTVLRWGYGNAVQLVAYPMLVLLAVATWRHRKRLRAYGGDPAWARGHAQAPSR